jgi:predicted nucleic-acid-binding protein
LNKYIVDTNALISFVTDRNLNQQKKIAPLFDAALQLKARILCHQHVLTEFIYVMEKVYKVPKPTINLMVSDFKSTPGVEIIAALDLEAVLSYWPASIPDFGDAVIASLGKNTKGSVIVSFDQKLIKELKKLGISMITF